MQTTSELTRQHAFLYELKAFLLGHDCVDYVEIHDGTGITAYRTDTGRQALIETYEQAKEFVK